MVHGATVLWSSTSERGKRHPLTDLNDPIDEETASASVDGSDDVPAYSYHPEDAERFCRAIDDCYSNVKYTSDIGQNFSNLFVRDSNLYSNTDRAVLRKIAYCHLRVNRTEANVSVVIYPLDSYRSLGERETWFPHDMRLLLEDLSARVERPFALALIWDLQFELRHGKVRNAAEKAATYYLKASGEEALFELNEVVFILRAWELARRVGLTHVEEAAIEIIHSKAFAESPGHVRVGVILPLCVALCTAPKIGRGKVPGKYRDETLDLLDDLLKRAGDPHPGEQICSVIRSVASDDGNRTKEANRKLTALYMTKAMQADSAQVSLYNYTKAAETARRFELPDLERRAVIAMQRTRTEDLEWMTFGKSVEMPDYVVDSLLEDYRYSEDWRQALAYWFNESAPSGIYEKNVKLAEELREQFVFRSILPTLRFGAHGLPEKTTSSPDDELEHDIVRHEVFTSRFQGDILAMALDAISARHTLPALDDLHNFLVDVYGADVNMTWLLAKSIIFFWNDDPLSAAYIAIPLVEAAARSLLVELDEPAYKAELGASQGQFVALGSLLPALLKCGLDVDWYRYLKALLLSGGVNLRNLIAHGLSRVLPRLTRPWLSALLQLSYYLQLQKNPTEIQIL